MMDVSQKRRSQVMSKPVRRHQEKMVTDVVSGWIGVSVCVRVWVCACVGICVRLCQVMSKPVRRHQEKMITDQASG